MGGDVDWVLACYYVCLELSGVCYYACLSLHRYLLCFLRQHTHSNRQRHHYCYLLLSPPSPPPHHHHHYLLCFLLGFGFTSTPSCHGEDYQCRVHSNCCTKSLSFYTFVHLFFGQFLQILTPTCGTNLSISSRLL